MYRKFFHYVLPSMLAFAFSSLYAIVDGFFIGQSIGDQGLAAINIAYPLVALIQATGTGLGLSLIHIFSLLQIAGVSQRNRIYRVLFPEVQYRHSQKEKGVKLTVRLLDCFF